MVALGSPMQEVAQATLALCEALKSSCVEAEGSVDCASIANILVQHCGDRHSQGNPIVVRTSLRWLNQMVSLDKGRTLSPLFANMHNAALCNVGNSSESRVEAVELWEQLQRMIDARDDVEVQTLVSTVVKYLDDDSEHCKFTALYTLHRLIKKFPDRMVQDGLVCESLLPVLSDPSEDCLTLALGLLCACFVSRPAEIRQLLEMLLAELEKKRSVLQPKWEIILRQLCAMLPAEQVFTSLAALLPNYEAQTRGGLAQIMSRILLTSRELFPLREKLRVLATPEVCSLFCALFRVWGSEPVAVLQLCLLCGRYSAANAIVARLSRVHVTMQLLVHIDCMVKLLETTIFAHVRMDLLAPDNSDLISTLYGLLLILPQSDTYTKLATRLNNLPDRLHLSTAAVQLCPAGARSSSDADSLIDFAALIEEFDAMQQQKSEQELLALQESIMDTESLQDMFNRLELKQKKEETNDSIAS